MVQIYENKLKILTDDTQGIRLRMKGGGVNPERIFLVIKWAPHLKNGEIILLTKY